MLATEELDVQLSATLKAIRNKDPRIYDKNVIFIQDDLVQGDAPREKLEKPVHLQDYHRNKLLQGDVGASEDVEDAPSKPMTFGQEQDALKKSILTEINALDGEGSDGDDGETFFKRKTRKKLAANGNGKEKPLAPKITEADVANADKNPELYLSNFMAARAWVPSESTNWQPFESDDDDDSNEDDKAE